MTPSTPAFAMRGRTTLTLLVRRAEALACLPEDDGRNEPRPGFKRAEQNSHPGEEADGWSGVQASGADPKFRPKDPRKRRSVAALDAAEARRSPKPLASGKDFAAANGHLAGLRGAGSTPSSRRDAGQCRQPDFLAAQRGLNLPSPVPARSASGWPICRQVEG